MTRHRTIIRLLAVLAAAALAKGCGDGDGPIEPPPDTPRPATVAVTPASAVLSALGATVQLQAEVRDQNGEVLTDISVAWASDSPQVATVDGSGLVTAVAEGSATITASAGEATGTAEVTVAQSPDSVSVAPKEATLAAVGDTLRLTAAAFDANGHAVEAAEFSWESGDDAVATVDGSGLVTAAGDGSATITASAGEATGTAEVTVEVVAVPIWIAVTPARATLLMGDTVRLAAEVRDAAGMPIGDATVAWSSADQSVASVDRWGLVRALATGETVITATVGGTVGPGPDHRGRAFRPGCARQPLSIPPEDRRGWTGPTG